MSQIESKLTEKRVFTPDETFIKKARVKGMEEYLSLCQSASENFEEFWSNLALNHVSWEKRFTKILNEENAPFYKWFEDGKLNASYNCIDRIVAQGKCQKKAIIFESDEGLVQEITYKQLLERVCKLANGIKKLGFKKGDRAIIYMPMSVEGIVAMQACARLGITHSVVFGGFSSKSLEERIIDVGASLIFTANEQVRGGKKIPLKKAVDEAIDNSGYTEVKKVVIYERTKATVKMTYRDILLSELVSGEDKFCEPVFIESEHPLFVLYTSGSTGKPKGIQHSTGGYLLQAILTMLYTFDIKDDDVFWCTADIGWITGHTYVAYGPLATGATQLIFEGVPTYPDAGRFWKMIQDHNVSVFYTAPTAIRALIKATSSNSMVSPTNFKLESLRILGTVGEPINPEAWMWYYEKVGDSKCPIVDTFWQTETGAHVITPLPGATPLVPGSCTLPFPGIFPSIVDETGAELPDGKGGFLVIQKPWPSMIRTIWGDAERFKKTYFPLELGGSLYLAGDGAVKDKETSYYTIMGRIDDVLNVSGHRLGTMEIESALVSNSEVAEAAVIGKPDDVTGESIVAFVVLKKSRPNSDKEIKLKEKYLQSWVTEQIGPIAKPKEIRFGDNLPKTRSGKIMRRLLRSLAKGEQIKQDISTLENPDILKQLGEKR
tara:strand:+ start:4005 stop:5987 length:1983 start_codon:yes stop_codon:yes gene_type:complete